MRDAPSGRASGLRAIGRASGLRAIAWLARHRFFVLLALTYAYFYQGADPNESSRFFLTRALVTRHTPDITPDAIYTIDKGELDGKYFSDKAPGISFLAVIPYALMRATNIRETRSVEHVELHLLTILFAGIPAAFAAFLLKRALDALGAQKKDRDLLVFAYAIGTLAFPYATLLYGHALAAMLVLLVYTWVVERNARGDSWTDRNLATAGAVAGLSFIVEYPTALALFPLLLFACAKTSRGMRGIVRAGLFVTAGALPWLLLHAAYTSWAFGSPFALPYKFVNQPIFSAHMTSGVFGISLPTIKATYGALLSPYRGLFFFSPVLALVFAGIASWIASTEERAIAWLTAIVLFVELWFATSYYAWDGGGAIGPRHLVPALALFVVPISFFMRRGNGPRFVAFLTVGASTIFVGVAVAVYAQPPIGDPFRADPLYSILVPHLLLSEISQNWLDLRAVIPMRDGAYNMGTLAGLGVTASLLVPIAAWVGYFAALRPRDRHPA